MAGTYTQIDPLQGSISVNIRGMNGLGRVNTMVDGVTQTYFGMAPANYHGGANTAAGVPLDPNFLAEVDVTRGSSAGSQGVNALAGSANMRTIGIDDVLREGRQTGFFPVSRWAITALAAPAWWRLPARPIPSKTAAPRRAGRHQRKPNLCDL